MNVATMGGDGRPHLVAMWYGFVDGQPGFWTYGKSQKIVNLERDPRHHRAGRVGATSYDELKGVELVGTGRVVRTGDVIQKPSASRCGSGTPDRSTTRPAPPLASSAPSGSPSCSRSTST